MQVGFLYTFIELADYQYIGDGSKIKGEGVIFKEIDKKVFEAIGEEFYNQHIHMIGFHHVGIIESVNNDSSKLVLFGWKEKKERILLSGKEKDAFCDENYSEVYYCRQDIYDLYIEHGTLKHIDLHEYIN